MVNSRDSLFPWKVRQGSRVVLRNVVMPVRDDQMPGFVGPTIERSGARWSSHVASSRAASSRDERERSRERGAAPPPPPPRLPPFMDMAPLEPLSSSPRRGASANVGEMLASRAGSRETTSQVVPHDQPDAAPFAPQVQAAPVAPPVQAAPLAPPSPSAVPIEAPALPATPAAHVMTPPPGQGRGHVHDSGRSRLAVIARTAQSKAMPRPDSFVADIEAELEAEQSRGAQGEESRGAEGEEPRGAEGEGSHGAEEGSHSHPTCVICFEPCNPNDAQYPLEALPCAHVFHVECLRAWRETVRITDRAQWMP